MADTNVNPPLNRTGTAPKPGRTIAARTRTTRSMPRSTRPSARGWTKPDVSFKRQWDAGLQAELDAALAGFDAASFEVASPRSGQVGRPAESRQRSRSGRPARRPHG